MRLVTVVALCSIIFSFQVCQSQIVQLPYGINVGSDLAIGHFKADNDDYFSGYSWNSYFNDNLPQLYKSSRSGEFAYEIPVAAEESDNRFDVTLYFVETDAGLSSKGSRLFKLSVNYKIVNEFDVFGTAESNTMSYTFKSILPRDGKIRIGLEKSNGDPMLSAFLIAEENYRVKEGALVDLDSVNIGGENVNGFHMESDLLFNSTDNSTETYKDEGDEKSVFSTGRRSTNVTTIAFLIKTDEPDNAKFSLDLLFRETEMWHQGDRVMELIINGKSEGIVDVLQHHERKDEVTKTFYDISSGTDGISVELVPLKDVSILSGFILRTYRNVGILEVNAEESTDGNDGENEEDNGKDTAEDSEEDNGGENEEETEEEEIENDEEQSELAKGQESSDFPAWNEFEVEDTSEVVPRHENCAVELGGKFYLIGGRRIQAVNVFDPKNRSWSQLSEPPFEINHCQCVAIGDKILIGMVFTGEFPNEIAVEHLMWFHPETDSWTNGTDIPVDRRRGSAATVVRGSKVFFINGNVGGHGAHSVSLNFFDAYDTETEEWEVLPSSPNGRDHGHAAIVENGKKIVVIGGRLSGVPNLFDASVSSVDIFEFDNDEDTSGKWTTAQDEMRYPGGGAIVEAIDDKTVVLSGGEGLGKVWGRTVIFDTESERFLDLNQGDMVYARHGTQLIRCKNGLYAIQGSGGQGGSPELSSVEVFTKDGSPPDVCE